MPKGFKKTIFGGFVVGTILVLSGFSCVQAAEISKEKVINLVNKSRLENGVGMLVENKILNMAAEGKAGDMIENDYFAHNSPQGVSPWYWFEKSGYDYRYAGENLAINFESVEDEHAAWMQSFTHRKNILNPNYEEIGVAIREGMIGGKPSLVVVQLFGTTLAASARKDALNKNKGNLLVKGTDIQTIDKRYSLGFIPIRSGEMLKPLNRATVTEYSFLNSLGYQIKNGIWKDFVKNENSQWILSLIVIFSLIVFNSIILSKKKHNNPFIAINTVVLMAVMTALLFWKI